MLISTLNIGEILREFGEILGKYRILDDKSMGSIGSRKSYPTHVGDETDDLRQEVDGEVENVKQREGHKGRLRSQPVPRQHEGCERSKHHLGYI